MPCTIDIDTGGTFTDGMYNFDGRIETVKVSTTPHDLTVCFLENLEEAARRFNISLESLLRSTSVIRYSNTIGTNTIIQRNGLRLGLIVSEGYEETLYGAESVWSNPEHPLPSFIRREMVVGVSGQLDAGGEVSKPLNRQEVLDKVQQLIDIGARAVVVCLKDSSVNPGLEQAIKQIVKEEFPTFYLGTPSLFLASEICDYTGDELRVNTTLLNAYIHREMARTLYKAEEKIRKAYRHPLLIVHSNGGVSRIAKTRAINTYNSGPAAGLAGAQAIGEKLGYRHMITADMGGTSLDIGFIVNQQKQYERTPLIEGMRTNHPMHKIDAIGAGGGSIAKVVTAAHGEQQLQIGPESAGSAPGPICFGRGGRKVTVTDVDVTLGYLDPGYFLGGRMPLDVAKAREAIERQIARPLGTSIEMAAWLIKQQVDGYIRDQIGELLKHETDLRREETVLFAYGGGGATHCVGFSAGLPIHAIVVSPLSPVFSAYGSSTMDVMHKYTHSRPIALRDRATASRQVQTVVLNLVQRAIRDMRGEGFAADDIRYTLECRLRMSDGEERVLAIQDFSAETEEHMAPIHEAGGEVITSLLLNASVDVAKADLQAKETVSSNPEAARRGVRESFWGPAYGWLEVPVYERERLQAGHLIMGPALIDARDTTCVLPHGYSLTVDQYGNGVIKEER